MGLSIQGIAKSYGAVIAIKQADMEISDGEVRAILGGNGSGKSTLAKVVSGLISKDSGTITYNGSELNFSSPADAKKHHVIMTSQELSLFNNLTVEENICICNVPKNGMFTNRNALKQKAQEVLDRMQLGHLMGVKVEELPPNQQYMIELAKALVQDPKILMIDEITSALYRADVEIVDDIIRELKEKGCIILFISHRMEELYAMCDSVTIMRNGETFGTYPMQEKTEDELLSLMVGSKIESYHGQGNEGTVKRDIFIKVPNIPIPTYGTTLNLEIGKGEIIGIAGLQGHGQVDLLNALYGLSGAIRMDIDGSSVTIHNPKDAVSHHFAYLSGDREKDGTFQERSLTENLAAVKELVKHEVLGDPRAALDSFHVKYNVPEALITSLSGGNQQKVVVGRWLVTKPRLLLLNDPTKGIDVKARNDLHQMFTALAKGGNAVVMISSDEDELVNITSMPDVSRVLVMYEGTISAVLEGRDITRENISAASMPGKKEVKDHE
ncbi:sugar ABC transporter ATP-binding protein [Porcincola sp. LCP21S3_C12]|uniref:sugar ABC transporter ATP-binding protein n=1 Tax=Porcincola sp. LCP21S3_C12 TaxID=3438798 RepID=UPI003F96C82D